LLEAIKNNIPAPKVDLETDFKMLISQTEYNQYFGRQLIGRVASGQIKKGDPVIAVN
jgi:GTP-binding protein